MDKDKLIVAQNCNSATAQVMAALVSAGVFTYEEVRANWSDLHGIVNANTFATAAAQAIAEAMPGVQVAPVPPTPPAAPQAPHRASQRLLVHAPSRRGSGRMPLITLLKPLSTSASAASRSGRWTRTSTAIRAPSRLAKSTVGRSPTWRPTLTPRSSLLNG